MKKNKYCLLLICTILSSCNKTNPNKFEEKVNINKPVVFYSTPVLKSKELTSSYTLDYDTDTLSFNDKTLYVGLDYEKLANQNADMIYNYIQTNSSKINRLINASGKEAGEDDHILRYVLVANNNDSLLSKLQIRAIRKRLNTLKKDSSGKDIISVGESDDALTISGKLSFDDKEFTLVEDSSIDLSSSTYSASYLVKNVFDNLEKGTSYLDFIITLDDTTSFDIYNNWAKANKVPVFGFGGSENALKAISEKTDVPYAGTVYVNNSYLAYMKMRSMINLIENRIDFYEYGITKPDSEGGVLKNTDLIQYKTENNIKQLLLSGKIINLDNASIFEDYNERNNYDDTLKPLSNEHTIWYNRILTSSSDKDDFEYGYELKYFDMLKIKTNEISTDDDSITYQTQSDKYYLSKFVNLNNYEGYMINLCNPVNGIEYTSALSQ